MKELEAEEGAIVEVRQTDQAREVKAKYKGYFFNHAYLNGSLQSDCEDVLLRYLNQE